MYHVFSTIEMSVLIFGPFFFSKTCHIREIAPLINSGLATLHLNVELSEVQCTCKCVAKHL